MIVILRSDNMRRLCCLVLTMTWLFDQPVVARQKCDPDLKVRAGDPLGYRQRGDRCEGMFLEEVSGSLLVASLHFPRGDFEPRSGTTVRLQWSLPPAAQVQVQAVSMKPKVFFRMDTVRPGDSTSYVWPTDFAETVRLKGPDIGLLSWADLPVGGRAQKVYSPVSVRERSGAAELVLLPQSHLDEVYYSVVALNAQGRVEKPVVVEQKLPESYSSGRPMRILLPALEPKRLYRVEIAARVRNGGTLNRDIYVMNY
jgi:hypothetical protein